MIDKNSATLIDVYDALQEQEKINDHGVSDMSKKIEEPYVGSDAISVLGSSLLHRQRKKMQVA